jgi:uncharacterized protein YcfJ
MQRKFASVAALSAVVVLGGCATPPMGPTVQVMPAPSKSFEAFQADQATCQQYASQQVAGQAEATNQQAVGGAILGTVLGAGLGAAVGGGRGAAVGAAAGSVVGAGEGVGASQAGQYGIQRRYDIAYSQCMYSRGNQVPGYQPAGVAPPPPNYPPPPPQGYAPPPPNYPPPPPPGYAPPY